MEFQFLTWQQVPPEGDAEGEKAPFLVLDYYNRVFALLHQQLERDGYRTDIPHPIRRRFWGMLPRRRYDSREGRPLVLRYIESVEHRLAQTIRECSLPYWLHLYRRLSPGAIGGDEQAATVGEVRATLEAAIQKYAQFSPCDRVGISGQIPMDRVLGGLLMAPEFDLERQGLLAGEQLVLTDFNTAELIAFYDAERLAYEVWRASAMLRIMGKGAAIEVDGSEICVFDHRSEELDDLVRIYDARNQGWHDVLSSSAGVVHRFGGTDLEQAGIVWLPTYNLTGLTLDEFQLLFDSFGFEFSHPIPSNFIWLPFDLRQFRDAHVPLAGAFRERYGVELDAVLVVIAALCLRIFLSWTVTRGGSVFRYWQRAYEGPYLREYLLDEIQDFLPHATQLLGLADGIIGRSALSRAIRFWELDEAERLDMDLAFPGPHAVFLPLGEDRIFIDYAWIIRRLFSLFVGVSIPDQNFKGDALEHLVRSRGSLLPVRACKAESGARKQVDAAFQVEDRLIIVECKAVGLSIGFGRGDPEAIRFRIRMVNGALDQVDDKANWLAAHPVGTNYSVARFKDILPLVVTPFVEYMPSRRSRYWLTDQLPRVLTPSELETALDDGTLANVVNNVVTIAGPA